MHFCHATITAICCPCVITALPVHKQCGIAFLTAFKKGKSSKPDNDYCAVDYSFFEGLGSAPQPFVQTEYLYLVHPERANAVHSTSLSHQAFLFGSLYNVSSMALSIRKRRRTDERVVIAPR